MRSGGGALAAWGRVGDATRFFRAPEAALALSNGRILLLGDPSGAVTLTVQCAQRRNPLATGQRLDAPEGTP